MKKYKIIIIVGMMLILMMSIAEARRVTHGVSMAGLSAENQKQGPIFGLQGSNLTFDNVTIHNEMHRASNQNFSAFLAYINTSIIQAVPIQNSTDNISLQFGDFSPFNITLIDGEVYMILIGQHGNPTGNWVRVSQAAAYPIQRPEVKWNGAHGLTTANTTGLNSTTVMINVVTIGVTNTTVAAPPPEPGDTINVSVVQPFNNTQYNTALLNFNLTVNASYSFNATLYINTSGVLTANQTRTGFSAGTNIFVNFNVSFPNTTEAHYTYLVQVFDNVTIENTSGNVFYIDRVFPLITTVFFNDTIIFRRNITGRFNITDDFLLFSYNVTIDSQPVAGRLSLNSTNFMFNLSRDISNLSIGNHTLRVRGADGHTAEALGGDYQISDCFFNDCLKFDFWDGGHAKIEGSSIFDRFTTERKLDRYTFDFIPSDSAPLAKTLTITSDMPIHIVSIPHSEYGTWLVMGEHWLDFVMPEERGAKTTFTRISPTEIEVSITNLKKGGRQKFTSIGDLNVVTQDFNFATTDFATTFLAQVSETALQSILLRINTTSVISTINANLLYDAVPKTVTKSSFTGYDLFNATFVTPPVTNGTTLVVNVTWNYTITGIANTEQGQLNFSQTILDIGVDNCSVFTTPAVELIIKNETDDNRLNGTIGGYFEVWVDSIQNLSKFNITWGTGLQNYSICINPPEATYNIFAQLAYRGIGDTEAAEKNYYFTNVTFNNVSFVTDLFLTDDTTQVAFSVRDEDDNSIPGAIIKVLTYDLETDTAKVTEIVRTDSNGVAQAQIILSTQFYLFIIEKDGIVLLQTTEATKITSTSQIFRVTLTGDYYEDFNVADNTVTSLTFNNATLQYTFTFNDITGEAVRGCLEIIKRSPLADTVVNSSCVTSSAGSITLGIGEPGSDTFIAQGSIDVNPNFVVETLSNTFDFAYKTLSDGGLLASFFLVLTVTVVGFFNPIVAVVLLGFSTATLIILDIFFLSWPVLMAFLILMGITMYRLSR